MTITKPQAPRRTLTRALVSQGYQAIDQWTSGLTAQDKTIYQARIGNAPYTSSLRQVAANLGISHEQVRNIEGRLAAGLRQYAGSDAGRPLAALCHALAQETGVLAPVEEIITLLTPQPGKANHGGAVLCLAGPYLKKDNWYYLEEYLQTNPTPELVRELAARHWMAAEEAVRRLDNWGMNPRYFQQWLKAQKQISQEGEYLLPAPSNMADRAYIALIRLGEPAPLTKIARDSGYQGKLSRLQIKMSKDGRFCRHTRYRYGLKEWELPQYSLLTEEIARVIAHEGGRMALNHLATLMYERFQRPMPWTIRTVNQNNRFRRWKEEVILRNDTETGHDPTNGQPMKRPTMGKGLFQLGDDRFGILLSVSRNVLNDSAASVTTTASTVMSLQRNQRYYFEMPDGRNVHLSHGARARKAKLAGVRKPLQELHATEGDALTLLLDMTAKKAELRLTRRQELTPGWETVARLTGANPACGLDGLAAVLNCEPGQVTNPADNEKGLARPRGHARG